MNLERIYKIIIAPIISEKSSRVTEAGNQYLFRVLSGATKLEIKQAVEMLFSVKVKAVQVLNQKGKTKRTARGIGKRNDVRKAYVKLMDGQDIDFSSVGK